MSVSGWTSTHSTRGKKQITGNQSMISKASGEPNIRATIVNKGRDPKNYLDDRDEVAASSTKLYNYRMKQKAIQEKKEAEAEAFRQELMMKNRNTVIENSRIDDSDYYDQEEASENFDEYDEQSGDDYSEEEKINTNRGTRQPKAFRDPYGSEEEEEERQEKLAKIERQKQRE